MWNLNWEKREGSFQYVLVPIYQRIWIQEKKDPFWSLLEFLCMYDNLNFTVNFLLLRHLLSKGTKARAWCRWPRWAFRSLCFHLRDDPLTPVPTILWYFCKRFHHDGERRRKGEGYTCQCDGDDERRSVGWNFALPLSSTPWHHSRNIWRTMDCHSQTPERQCEFRLALQWMFFLPRHTMSNANRN